MVKKSATATLSRVGPANFIPTKILIFYLFVYFRESESMSGGGGGSGEGERES